MFLAHRELKHSKLNFGLLSFIIFLIIYLVFFITGLANGLSNELKSAIADSPAKTFILQKKSDNRFSRSQISDSDAKKLSDKYNLTSLSINQRTIINSKKDQEKTDISYFAIDANKFLNPKVIKGKSLSNSSITGVVASDKLSRLGYKLGDTFKDSASKSKFKIIGFTHNKSYAHGPVIFINKKQNEKITFNSQNTNSLVSKKSLKHIKGFDTVNKDNIIKAIPGFKEEQGSLTMMITFLYLISVVVLGVFFYIITLQKLPQLGTLKALGASTFYLGKNLISEVLIITLIALFTSDILILLTSMALPVTMPFRLSILTFIGTNILFILIAAFSTIISLFKIKKVDPVSAIGGGN